MLCGGAGACEQPPGATTLDERQNLARYPRQAQRPPLPLRRASRRRRRRTPYARGKRTSRRRSLSRFGRCQAGRRLRRHLDHAARQRGTNARSREKSPASEPALMSGRAGRRTGRRSPSAWRAGASSGTAGSNAAAPGMVAVAHVHVPELSRGGHSIVFVVMTGPAMLGPEAPRTAAPASGRASTDRTTRQRRCPRAAHHARAHHARIGPSAKMTTAHPVVLNPRRNRPKSAQISSGSGDREPASMQAARALERRSKPRLVAKGQGFESPLRLLLKWLQIGQFQGSAAGLGWSISLATAGRRRPPDRSGAECTLLRSPGGQPVRDRGSGPVRGPRDSGMSRCRVP